MAIALISTTNFATRVVDNNTRPFTTSIWGELRKLLSFKTLRAGFKTVFNLSYVAKLMATFGYFVRHIIQRSANKKVVYIDTQSVITSMADEHPRGDTPITYNPSITMSTNNLSLIDDRPISSTSFLSIFSSPLYTIIHRCSLPHIEGGV